MNSQNDTQNKNEGFYRAFEDKFRGSREVIKSRLRIYLPLIEPLKAIHDICNVIDLGCGRGEWLELIKEIGMSGHGVDIDDNMLSACRERGLSVETADAISHLKYLPDESQVIVSGFHIIEHMPFSSQQVIVQEAFRVLKPAGLLILETPNPENLIVGTASFYLDPTHIHPVPNELLAFLTEYYGFHRSKILRLQEALQPTENNRLTLFNVLFGVSSDYAAVAQKHATEEQLAVFDLAFDKTYGFSLDNLATQYDFQLSDFEAQLNDIRAQLSDIQTDRDQLQQELSQLLHSQSWRMTAPLRKAMELGRRLFPQK